MRLKYGSMGTNGIAQLGLIYVVRGGDLYKIGSTNGLKARIPDLRSSSPVPLHLEHSFEAAYFKDVEKLLHQRFVDRHIRGEWFCLTDDDLRFIKNLEPLNDRDWRSESERIFNCVIKLRKPRNTEMIFARVDERFHVRLGKAAEILDRPASQIVRECVKRELDQLAKKYPALRK